MSTNTFSWSQALMFSKSVPSIFWILLPLLSLSSWFIESLKWRFLVLPIKHINMFKSFFQNLCGQAASFLTPLRAGEFIVKSSYYNKASRKPVLRAVLLGNLSQMTITVLLGIMGWLFLYNQSVRNLFILVIVMLLVILLAPRMARRFNFERPYYPILGYSLLRYILFSSCWTLLLVQYSSSSYTLILASIAAMYLSVSIVPSMQVFDLAIKWTVASFFTSTLGISIEIMTAIVAIIWVNNTLLPVILGSLLLPFTTTVKTVAT